MGAWCRPGSRNCWAIRTQYRFNRVPRTRGRCGSRIWLLQIPRGTDIACLKALNPAGTLVSVIGTCAENSARTGLDPVQFDKVTDIAWDASGELLVTDGDLGGLNSRVLKLDGKGAVHAAWSAPGDQPGSGPKQFNLPHALVVDRCDRMWVADALNHRVQVIGSDGSYRGELTSFGTLGVYAIAFGASFSSPAQSVLFVGASPSSGGGTGRIFLFVAPMDCMHPDVAELTPMTTFDVPIPLLDVDDAPSFDDSRSQELGCIPWPARRQPWSREMDRALAEWPASRNAMRRRPISPISPSTHHP